MGERKRERCKNQEGLLPLSPFQLDRLASRHFATEPPCLHFTFSVACYVCICLQRTKTKGRERRNFLLLLLDSFMPDTLHGVKGALLSSSLSGPCSASRACCTQSHADCSEHALSVSCSGYSGHWVVASPGTHPGHPIAATTPQSQSCRQPWNAEYHTTLHYGNPARPSFRPPGPPRHHRGLCPHRCRRPCCDLCVLP